MKSLVSVKRVTDDNVKTGYVELTDGTRRCPNGGHALAENLKRDNEIEHSGA